MQGSSNTRPLWSIPIPTLQNGPGQRIQEGRRVAGFLARQVDPLQFAMPDRRNRYIPVVIDHVFQLRLLAGMHVWRAATTHS